MTKVTRLTDFLDLILKTKEKEFQIKGLKFRVYHQASTIAIESEISGYTYLMLQMKDCCEIYERLLEEVELEARLKAEEKR